MAVRQGMMNATLNGDGNAMLGLLPAVLPAVFFLLAMAAAASRCGLRQGFLIATVVYTLCVVGATELLSVPALLQLPQVAAFWAVASALAALWLWRKGDRQALYRRLRRARPGWAGGRGELVGVAIALAAVFLIGVLSPPNNWESMAYRMMRVAMWEQQGSVAHYATPYVTQLLYPPLGSWHILHLQVLAGSDRFANTPEWLAHVGCAVAASLIAKELRQPFRVQLLAAVLAATLPTSLLQGSSTQGNVLAAYWLLCAALLFVQHLGRPAWWRLACCGAAVGFALLARPTMYVFGPPVALALALYGVLACRQPRRVGLALAAVLAIAVTLNAGHYARNWELFGHPVSPSIQRNHINERFGFDLLAANLLRNSLLHWGLPWAKFNDGLLEATADLLGGIPNPPEATYGRSLTEAGIRGRFNEGQASNLLHYWLLAATALGLVLLRKRMRPGDGAALTGYLLAGWLLAVLAFSGILVWQQWNTRYDVGLFMLGCPLAATFLAAAFRQRRAYLHATAGLFLVASLPWVLLKESAPVFKLRFDYETVPAETLFSATRARAYFNHLGGNGSYMAYTALADAIAELNPSVVGLHHPYKWEFGYPLYRLLRDRLPSVRLTYYDVRGNPSASLARRRGEPGGPENDEASSAWPDVVVKAHANRRRLRGEGSVYQTHPAPLAGIVMLRRRAEQDTET